MSLSRNCLAALVLMSPLVAARPQDDLVTLNVQDEELTSVLNGLSIQYRINLVAGDVVEGRVTINLYDVPLEDALSTILATQKLAFVKEGDFYRVVTLEELDAALLGQDAFDTRIFTLNHHTAQEAQQLLAPLLTSEGQISVTGGGQEASGGGGGGSGGGGEGESGTGRREVIVVRERRSNLDQIAKTLAELDRPPKQILLEATILAVDLGEENLLGVNFNVLGGIGFNEIGASSDMTGMTGYNVAGSTFDDLLFSGQTFGFTQSPPGRGLSLGLVKNQVAVFVEALEETTNASILSNPKVVALNGQEAKIIVGGRLGYKTVVSTNTSALEEVNFLDTGTQLRFRPYIAEDGWIRMEVQPSNSTGVIDPVSGIPSESTAEITTTVLMRDGQTLIIGGLISERIQTTRSQIPILGSLPIIGALFGRNQDSIARSELVILLTTHLIDPDEEEQRVDEVQERWEAVRRGHLDSLSPHLRPRMAESYRADAEVLWRQGDLNGALGAAERAMSLDPTSVPVATLRQRLLRELAVDQLQLDEEQQSLQVLETLDWLCTPVEGKPHEEIGEIEEEESP